MYRQQASWWLRSPRSCPDSRHFVSSHGYEQEPSGGLFFCGSDIYLCNLGCSGADCHPDSASYMLRLQVYMYATLPGCGWLSLCRGVFSLYPICGGFFVLVFGLFGFFDSFCCCLFVYFYFWNFYYSPDWSQTHDTPASAS